MSRTTRYNKSTLALSNPRAPRRTSVHCSIRVCGDRYKVPTSVSVHPDDWDDDLRRVRDAVRNSRELNRAIREIQAAVDEAYRIAHDTSDGRPTKELVSSIFDERNGSEVLSVIRRVADEQDRTERDSKKTMALHRHLTQLFDNRGITGIKVGEFGVRVCENLRSDFHADLGLEESTQWSYFKLLRQALIWAERRGLDGSEGAHHINKRLFRVRTRRRGNLTATETQRLLSVRPKSERERTAIDYARIQVATGMRFGDISKIHRGEMACQRGPRGDWQIEFETTKNKKQVFVPGLSKAENEAFDRLSLDAPLSNPTYNGILKRLARRGALDRRWESRTGGSSVPIYENISSHDLKRTFVRLATERGLPVAAISQMTGNSMKTILDYQPESREFVSNAVQRAEKQDRQIEQRAEAPLRIIFNNE